MDDSVLFFDWYFFVFLYQDQINLKKLKSFNILLIIFLIISPTLYSLRSIYNDSRTGYEGKKIALQIEKEWKTISKTKYLMLGFQNGMLEIYLTT